MNNIMYSPEAFGLSVVAEVEYSDGCYQFDTRIVWKDNETGKLYTARDAGCSCPVPFEDYNRSNIDEVDFDALKAEVAENTQTGDLDVDYCSYPTRHLTSEQAADFLRALHEAGA